MPPAGAAGNGCRRLAAEGPALDAADRAARTFKLFSVGARVRIVQLLQGRALCVGALAERLGISSAAVSQHLRILRDAGLVEPERHGTFVHYRLDAKALAACRKAVDRLLNAGRTDGCTSCAQKKGDRRNVR